MSLGRIAAAATVGYLAGTIPSASLAARAATGGLTDLRAAGTGNPGAANASAVLGVRWGAAVMAADITKAAVAARFGSRLIFVALSVSNQHTGEYHAMVLSLTRLRLTRSEFSAKTSRISKLRSRLCKVKMILIALPYTVIKEQFLPA